MSSREAIKTLILMYAELVDAGDFDGLGALLSNATVTGAATVTGQEAITQNFHNTVIRYADGTPRTSHVVTNFLIQVDEEAGTATSRSTFTAYQALPDFPLQPIAVEPASTTSTPSTSAPGTTRASLAQPTSGLPTPELTEGCAVRGGCGG